MFKLFSITSIKKRQIEFECQKYLQSVWVPCVGTLAESKSSPWSPDRHVLAPDSCASLTNSPVTSPTPHPAPSILRTSRPAHYRSFSWTVCPILIIVSEIKSAERLSQNIESVCIILLSISLFSLIAPVTTWHFMIGLLEFCPSFNHKRQIH